MNGEPEGMRGAPWRLAKGRGGVYVVGALLLSFVLILIGATALGPYAEYQWFLHDARHPEVFRTEYATRSLLFSLAFFPAWLLIHVSLRRAFGSTLVYLVSPERRGQILVSNVLGFLQDQGANLIRIAAPLIAAVGALGFAGEWTTWLQAAHAQRFGVYDPTFGIDLGFFVFTLPWYRAVAGFVFGVLLLLTVATVAIYAGLQAMAALAKIELGRPQVRLHLHLLLGATLLSFSALTWLQTYEVGYADSGQFTGGGLAAMQALGAQRVFVVLLALSGIATLVNGRVGRAYRAPAVSAGVLFVWFVVAIVGYPMAVQRLRVDPDRLRAEAPYAAKAIRMTRYGYGIGDVEVRDFAPTSSPTRAEVAASRATLDNVRLWDPNILRTAMEVQQGIRPYYAFSDFDIDRYVVDGRPTVVMLAPRQIRLEGLDANARNWTNERLRYTHGYGLVVSRVDRAEPDGRPVLLAQDVPQRSTPAFPIAQPRIYFGDAVDDSGLPVDEYAIVDTGQPEFDYPTSVDSAVHRWQGDRGIPIGGFLNRLAFSAALGDGNLLVSPNVRMGSRLLMHRNVVDRATRIYPFLRFDADPYTVILNGRVLWVLDAYTTSGAVPYSAREGYGDRTLNYIRNSVKVVVDAYSGETTAYAVAPDEPVLRVNRAIYPGLIRDASEIPTGLREHFRYPEDLLWLQSVRLCTYHVSDPAVFLSNGDVWNIAQQRGAQGEKEPIRPFYVELQLPDEARPGFVQILPFTPNGRPTMSGWLAAHCDPDRYGKLTLYRLGQGTPIAGPEQVEGTFNATPAISNINRQFQNEQSQILVGNLLVLPVGKSFVYLESLFLQARTPGLQAAPSLQKVILATNDRVVVGDTYAQAAESLFGTAEGTPSGTAAPSPSPLSASVDAKAVRTALGLLDQADAALRKGDFATYGRLQRQGRDQLRNLLR